MTISLLDSLRPGSVVEYIQNNQPVMGWVQEVRTGRVKLVNINQRDMKLPLARILPWAGPCIAETSSRSEVLSTLKTLNARRESLLVSEKVFRLKSGGDVSFTFSCGVADNRDFDADEVNSDSIVELADKRLYKAKNRGRNRIVFK